MTARRTPPAKKPRTSPDNQAKKAVEERLKAPSKTADDDRPRHVKAAQPDVVDVELDPADPAEQAEKAPSKTAAGTAAEDAKAARRYAVAGDLADEITDTIAATQLRAAGEIVQFPPEALVPDVPPRPRNVIEAIAFVEATVGGIRKLTSRQRLALGMAADEKNGVPFPYRGIDQIAQAAQPLFGDAGVVIVPNTLSFASDAIQKGAGTSWTRTVVQVEWTLYGPGGIDDHIKSITFGEGDDNSDKGYNKAMTGAFKNLLLRVLCIGDPADDTDNHNTGERTSAPDNTPKNAAPKPEPQRDPNTPGSVSRQQMAAIGDLWAGVELDVPADRKRLLEIIVDHPLEAVKDLTHTEAVTIINRLKSIRDGFVDIIVDEAAQIVGVTDGPGTAKKEAAAPADIVDVDPVPADPELAEADAGEALDAVAADPRPALNRAGIPIVDEAAP